MTISVVILAAGRGTRMLSSLPKVLHTIGGKSMLEHVVSVAQSLEPEAIFVVYGHQGDLVQEKSSHLPVKWVHQEEQLGTGHALMQVIPHLKAQQKLIVLSGDVPLISSFTLRELLSVSPDNQVGIVTANVDDPSGLGRIIRDHHGNFLAIVEHKDATLAQRCITEINAGIYCFPAAYLPAWLSQLNANNAQKELYLTDVLGIALQEGVKVNTVLPRNNQEILGINDRVQLAIVERCYQKQQAELLMLQGVTLRDPARVDIRGELVVGQDSVIDANVVFEGKVTIGVDCFIGPNCIIKNSVIGDGVMIKANSMIENSVVEDHCHIGPFARIRPDSYLECYSHVGNFVEIKKSRLGHSSKVNHLSYIGDASVGHSVNIGAGTITCNYDGVSKHQTIIGDGAFIGSGTELVAPVEVGAGAFIGAGSTITAYAPAHELTLARVKQETIKNWKRREKK